MSCFPECVWGTMLTNEEVGEDECIFFFEGLEGGPGKCVSLGRPFGRDSMAMFASAYRFWE